MYNKILNYSIRVLIIVFGILIFFDAPGWSRGNENVLRVFGIVMILFGIYRIIAYNYAVNSEENEEDDDDNEKKYDDEKNNLKK